MFASAGYFFLPVGICKWEWEGIMAIILMIVFSKPDD